MIPIPRQNDSLQDTMRKLVWATLAANFGIASVADYNVLAQQILNQGGDVNDFSQLVENSSSVAAVSRVGGFTAVVDASSTVDTAAHAANDVVVVPTMIQGILRPGNNSGVLHSVTVIDTSAQAAELWLAFWIRPPVGHADRNEPFVIPAQGTLQGLVRIEQTDYVSTAAISMATKVSLGLPVISHSDKDLWFSAFTTGTPTYAANALTFTFGLLQD